MEMSVKTTLESYLRKKVFNMPTHVIAPSFPLRINEDTGNYETYGISDLTKVVDQNIKMTLLTIPGERMMDENFGVGLSKYLFENDVTIARGDGGLPPLRENILSQLSTYVPYITIQDLDINFSGNTNLMNIKIKYFVNESGTSSVFDLTIGEVSNSIP
jgi:phage baseplate assembly protein W